MKLIPLYAVADELKDKNSQIEPKQPFESFDQDPNPMMDSKQKIDKIFRIHKMFINNNLKDF